MTLAPPRPTPTRRVLTTVGHAAVGVPVGLAWTVTLLTGLGAAVVAFPLGLPIAGATLVLARLGAELERDRATALLGRRPDGEPAPADGQRVCGRILAVIRSASTRRDVVCLATFGPVVLTLVAIAAGWLGILIIALTSGWWLPAGSVELGSLAIGRPVVTTLLALHGIGAARIDLRHQAERAEHRQALPAPAARAERERIERDLHDGLQPLLVSAAVTVAGARRSLAADPEGTARRLDEAQAHLRSAMDDVRSLVQGLAPRSLREAGLDAALGELAAGAAIDADLHVALAGPVADDAAASVYCVAAETLTNAVRHSSADRFDLRVTSSAEGVEVAVVDGGLGGSSVRPGRIVRIAVVEDHAVLRSGLERLLTDAGHTVTGAHADADDLLTAVAADAPDLVIADVRLPPTHTDEGVRAAAELRRRQRGREARVEHLRQAGSQSRRHRPPPAGAGGRAVARPRPRVDLNEPTDQETPPWETTTSSSAPAPSGPPSSRSWPAPGCRSAP